MPNWNQEIKLSSLFKRTPKAPKPEAAPEEPNAPRERKSLFKKELSLGRRGGEAKEPKAAKTPKEPKAAKARRGKGGAAAVPQIPLMRAFDLLPKDNERQSKGRRPSTAQLILAVAALVVIGAIGSMFMLMSAGVADKRAERDALREQLAALNVPAEEPQAEDQTALVQERDARTGALSSALGARVAWDRLLREFSLVLPEDVWLTSLNATGTPKADPAAPATDTAKTSAFTINGYTHEQDGVARLLARLSVLPELSSVQLLSSARTKVGEDDVVQFTIAATVKPGGGATA